MIWAWRIPKAAVACATAMVLILIATLALARRPFHIVAPPDDVQPMGSISFEATRELSSAKLKIQPPVAGDHVVKGRKVEFRPHDPLRPGATYTVTIHAEDISGEQAAHSLTIRVAPLHDALWVYVKLDKPTHQVFVYRGDTLVRSMIASGGRPGDETPEGVFRIQNRGYHFFSQKYQEGAYYWVRIFGNYLFHTVPVDIDGNVIEEEAKKLGCPASHGCVRLSFPDAEWFYENVPDGTLVVIDRT